MKLSMDVKQNSLSVAKIPSKESNIVSSYQFGLRRGGIDFINGLF